MAQLTYDDFKNRINIQDLLVDAGYRLNRRDGMRYPSYVRIGSDGNRVRGDKFIVTANGLCCFQPPDRKNYNVISFIKEHPDLFAEYTPGMSRDRLVNLVCNRLLNNPAPDRAEFAGRAGREARPFDIYEYDAHAFDNNDWESQKAFYPYFKNRGINLDTQRAFSDHFFLATRRRTDGKSYTNLSFPLTLASSTGKNIVGLEERSRPNADGKTAYKGMAAGSNASEGMWIARLEDHRSDMGFTRSIEKVQDVYWFESAFDAMAFYQLEKSRKPTAFHDLGNAVFVSTGGSPTNAQFRSMLAHTPEAVHHICFDRDLPGQSFSVFLALHSVGRNYSATLDQAKGTMSVRDLCSGTRQEISLRPFDFEEVCRELGIDNRQLHYYPCDKRYKDWNDQLLDKPVEEDQEQEENRSGGFRR